MMLAPESASWCSISAAFSSGFIGSTVIPALSAPKYAVRNSGTFGS